MKRILYLILGVILVISSCSINQSGSGYLTIKTPEIINPPLKSVIYNDTQIDPLKNQSFLRYVLLIETKDGKRIKTEYLKTNEEKVIDVPAGIPLNFFVGVYIAESTDSFTEKFNTFVLSDVKENVILMEGETKLIEFNLDLTKSTKVKSYYGSQFTGPLGTTLYSVLNLCIDDNTGNPYFTILPLSPKILVERTIVLTYDGSSFNSFPLPPALTNDYIKIVKVENSVDNRYWVVSSNKIYRVANINFDSIGSAVSNTDVQISSDLFGKDYLKKAKKIISLYFPKQGAEPRDRYYYFIDYGMGFLGFNWGLDSDSWSSVEDVKMDFTLNKVRQYSLLLDMKQDIGTRNTFVITKLGAFYAREIGLAAFSQGDYIKGINSFKKIINISEEKNGNPILITKVMPTSKRVYIGTRKGLYYIDKSNSYWIDFVNSNENNMVLLDSKALNKIEDVNEEIIDNMFLLNINDMDVLVVGTPKKIMFKNMNNGKKDYLTLNDGLLFVPIGRLLNIVATNEVDFISHTIAPVVDIIVDNNNNLIWIGTRFGLSSISVNQLNIW